MPSTYLQLTNRILRKLNEVELTSATFADAKGVHATVKDAVNEAISEINSYDFEWPFNAYEHTQTLIAGTNEYAWPTTFKTVDWTSFQIQKDDSLNVNSTYLKKINRDYWYQHLKDADDDAGSDGISAPKYVFEAHGTGFGVSPVPDAAYDVKYRYYVLPTELSAYNDEPTIPSAWDYVIVSGAMWHSNLFKENPGGTDRIEKRYRDNLNAMRTILINKTEDMRDTMIVHGKTFNYDGFTI